MHPVGFDLVHDTVQMTTSPFGLIPEHLLDSLDAPSPANELKTERVSNKSQRERHTVTKN